MPERFEKILRVACLLFAVVLLFQLARLAVRGDPLKKAKIPALPALAETNVPAVATGTNSAKEAGSQKAGSGKPTTNSVSRSAEGKTNVLTEAHERKSASTN